MLNVGAPLQAEVLDGVWGMTIPWLDKPDRMGWWWYWSTVFPEHWAPILILVEAIDGEAVRGHDVGDDDLHPDVRCNAGSRWLRSSGPPLPPNLSFQYDPPRRLKTGELIGAVDLSDGPVLGDGDSVDFDWDGKDGE